METGEGQREEARGRNGKRSWRRRKGRKGRVREQRDVTGGRGRKARAWLNSEWKARAPKVIPYHYKGFKLRQIQILIQL